MQPNISPLGWFMLMQNGAAAQPGSDYKRITDAQEPRITDDNAIRITDEELANDPGA